MTDYSQLSDRDIDALVLQKIYENQASDKDIMRAWLRGGFKYTTNPADAWPIIESNEISLVNDGEWVARYGSIYHVSEKPLRSAMIVFLKMVEANDANPI